MGRVRVFAIDSTVVRGWFAAPPEMAARLRRVAMERLRTEVVTPPAPGLLGRLGPLHGRDPWAPVMPIDQPTSVDIDTLLSGRRVPPDRLDAAWRVLEALLDAESAAHAEVSASPAMQQPAGLASAELWHVDLRIPLDPTDGVRARVCPAELVPQLRERLLSQRPEADTDLTSLLDAVEPVLDVAASRGLDVVALVGE